MFSLHPRLAADTILLGDFPLSHCLLMNDMHYLWQNRRVAPANR